MLAQPEDRYKRRAQRNSCQVAGPRFSTATLTSARTSKPSPS
jgi:hypothetical protein